MIKLDERGNWVDGEDGKDVPQEVKRSEFGCRNCLWNSCECQSGSMYKPSGDTGCQGYTYYD